MSGEDEDDKPTVVLDLNALKKQALKDSDDLTDAGRKLSDLLQGEAIEFNVLTEAVSSEPEPEAAATPQTHFDIILFDFQSDYFQLNQDLFPVGFNYLLATTLPELNSTLAEKKFKVIFFNYDANPKAINQLTAQIKKKFPHVKTMIMAKNISPEKARAHAATPSGANAYYQFPINTEKLEGQLMRMYKAAVPEAK